MKKFLHGALSIGMCFVEKMANKAGNQRTIFKS
jgi:hypothetical protein